MNALIKATAKRYRYTGKERDEESGLYYHGARYYIPWLCRWSASDPLEAKNTTKSSYDYCSGNPVSKFDPDGRDEIYFNYLYTSYHRSFNLGPGNDIFQPQNWGIPTAIYNSYRWVTVVKNDKPNTYHVNKHYYDSYEDGSPATIRSVLNSMSWYSDPHAVFGPTEDSKLLYQAVSDFGNTLRLYYPDMFMSELETKYPSPSTQNAKDVHKLLNNAIEYQKVQRQEDMERKVMMFAVELLATEFLILKLRRGASWISRAGEAGLDNGIIVSEATIAKALEGSTLSTTQSAVSLPVIERYVKMLLENKVAPAIRVADGIIVEGNHRYVAGRLVGKEPEILPGAIAPSQRSLAKPIQEIKIDPIDWGNK